jgi:UDP-N-acetyl-D-glucosamine/UDP-N-acetyl-D-galactosamine dehydrogenase
MSSNSSERIAVIGLGYVGLPVALAFSRAFPGTIGFDIDEKRIAELAKGIDHTGESSSEELARAKISFTSDPERLKRASFFVVAVPTPVDGNRQPDLRALTGASEIVGRALTPGATVVFESTVYPGVTEDVCGPLLERTSGLKRGRDFTLGYSPERINPGDREHRLEQVVKVVAGEDAATLDRVARAYGTIVPAGIHRAPSIRVAEAAKVIENTQRDLNIALMNELALIFDRLGLRTSDVLAAAGTKWNFLRFTPGLVGGHCIGVDPYYLTAKAEAVGYHPEVILAGRRINDGMGRFVAQKLLKLLSASGRVIGQSRIGVLGLTFKENVPDLRNSRVPDIIAELREFGVEPLVHDALASAEAAEHEYGITFSDLREFRQLDGLVLAVPHRDYLGPLRKHLIGALAPGGVFIDVKSALSPIDLPGATYWSL